jgi:hypothetical protein
VATLAGLFLGLVAALVMLATRESDAERTAAHYVTLEIRRPVHSSTLTLVVIHGRQGQYSARVSEPP